MRSNSGTTLIELAITTSILAIIIVLTLTFVSSVSESSGVLNQVTSMQQKANEIIEKMAESLREAKVQGLATAGDNNITFQIPVDYDNDQDLMDNAMAIEWGTKRMDLADTPVKGLTQKYEFVKTGEFSEASRSVDLNQDDDLNDVFDVGHVDIVFPAGIGTDSTGSVTLTEFRQSLTPDCVIQLKGQTAADIDNDGNNDPIFWQDGNTIRTTIFFAKTEEQEPVMVKVSSAVLLRNPQ